MHLICKYKVKEKLPSVDVNTPFVVSKTSWSTWQRSLLQQNRSTPLIGQNSVVVVYQAFVFKQIHDL